VRRRLAAVGLFAVGLLLFGGSPKADAHALLSASEPAAGAQLDRAPTRVVLTFTEPPDASLSVVHVLDADGNSVEKGKATAVTGQRNTVAIAVGDLDKGTYTVSWRTTSSVDGHTTAGSFAFGVQVAPSAVTTAKVSAPPGPSTLSIAGRWALYLGLAAIVGAWAFAVATRRRMFVAWLIAGAGGAALAADLLRSTDASVATLARSTTGTKLLVELAALAATGVAVLIAGRVATVAAAGTMLTRAWAGHAAASTAPWFTIGVQWVHLVAIGVWVGGLPWLFLALRRTPAADRGAVVRRFSRVATVAVVITIASGVTRAVAEVGSWRALFHTGFGTALLIKVAVVAVLIAFGTFNRWRRAPRPTLAVEALVGAVVLTVTAALAGYPPAKSVVGVSRPAVVVASGSDFGTTLRVRLEVSPGLPGPNHFLVKVTDYDTKRVVPAQSVQLRLAPEAGNVAPATVVLERTRRGWEVDSTALAMNGRWRAVVVVTTDAGGTEIPLRIETRRLPQRITAQRSPGLPTIYTITIGTRQVQTYVDPGRAGANDVHVTFVGADGKEVPTDLARLSGRDERGRAVALTPRKLGPGHFVAGARLHKGAWRFDFESTDGLAGYFKETVR
jgi:copper transport protein